MKTLEISDEIYEKIKDQLGKNDFDISKIEDMVGKSFFFRTVTYHLVGRVENTMGMFLRLADASWVADSGRFTSAIKDGTLNEVEPVGVAYVNLNTVTDFFPWKHELPTKQK